MVEVEYVMKAPEGETVTLTFTNFTLEFAYNCTYYDWIEIYEGEGTGGNVLLQKTCGINNPLKVRSATIIEQIHQR